MTVLRRNVLIFHAAALGDFVVTWPLALALGRVFPQSRVMYVTAASKGALAERVLGVESVDVESGWHALFTKDGAPPESALRRLTGAHTIVTFLARPDDAWTQNVRRLAPDATIVHLWTKPQDDPALPITEQLGKQLQPYPVIRAAYEQLLRSVNERGIAVARGTLGGPVIHPGSGSLAKNWPLDRFIDLADQLEDVRFVLGEAEVERLSMADVHELERHGPIVQPKTYVDLLSVLLTARAVIGNDSGPAHLAAITGTPTVALFGQLPPHPWRPIGPAVSVVYGTSMSAIGVVDVLGAVRNYCG